MNGGSSNGYGVTLGIGQGWHMIATKGLNGLLDEMAHIMGLHRCGPDSRPKMLLAGADSNKGECLDIIASSYPDSMTLKHEKEWKSSVSPFLRWWSHPDHPDVVCEVRPRRLNHVRKIVAMTHILYPLYCKLMQDGGLPLHSALIERQGTGIMLLGPGNVGKTTCCHRVPHPWRALCDDEVLVVPGREKQYLVHPFPTWSDYLFKRPYRKTRSVERHVRLSAIFFLEQSDSDEIRPVGQGEATVGITRAAFDILERHLVNEEVEEARKVRLNVLENACRLVRSAPTYTLHFTRQGRFWEQIENVAEVRA